MSPSELNDGFCFCDVLGSSGSGVGVGELEAIVISLSQRQAGGKLCKLCKLLWTISHRDNECTPATTSGKNKHLLRSVNLMSLDGRKR